MKHGHHFPIGLRTAKSALAVMLALLVVEHYGATGSKLIFALIGALSAMEPTFKGSVRNCLTQICGVVFGAFFGIWMRHLPIDSIYIIGIGVLLIITVYHLLHLTLSPALPCIVLVTVCTTPSVSTLAYATGRIWDTAIGLGIGIVVNMLVFPYNNSRQIRETVKSLDKELIVFLEDMFDGDDVLPDAKNMSRTIGDMERQLAIFSNQKLFLALRRQQHDLEIFRTCEAKAQELVARMVVLSRIEQPGCLNTENRSLLENCGADIRDSRCAAEPTEIDIVTNYQVTQILKLRQELLEVLRD